MNTAGGRAERLALWAGAAGGALGIVAGLLLGPDPLALWGERSIGTVAVLVAVLVGAAAFAVAYVAATRASGRHPRARWRRVLQAASLTLAAAGVAVLLTASVFALFQSAFRDLELDPLARVVVLGATGGAAGYALATLAATITSGRLAVLIGLFMVAGVFASMLTADEADWWEHNFSTLGMGDAASAAVFNLTLAVAGIVITTLADFLTTDLHSRRWATIGRVDGVRLVRTLLIAVGVLLFGVGLVPFDVSALLHNLFAYGLLAGFAVLIVAVPLVIVGLPTSFTTVTTATIVALLVAFVLYIPIGYLNLTALELVAMVLIFAWMMLLARTIAARPLADADDAEPSADPVATPRTSSATVVGALALAVAGAGGAVVGALIARRRRDDATRSRRIVRRDREHG